MYFFVSVIEMTALILHFFSSLNYYTIIASVENENKISSAIRKISKISYIKISIIVFTFSFFVFIYEIFKYKIESETSILEQNRTKIIYLFNPTEFIDTNLCKLLNLFCFLFRDGFILLLLIMCNIFIYKKAYNAFKKKSQLVKRLKNVPSSDGKKTNNNKRSKIEKNALKLTLMMFFVNANFIIGRLPILVTFVFQTFYPEMKKVIDRLFEITTLTVFLSYTSFFFLYYFFNKQFRKIFLNYFRKK